MKNNLMKLVVAVLIMLAIGLGLYYLRFQQKTKEIVIHKPESLTRIANPASVNCTDKGGQLEIKKAGDNGEYGVCIFEDNRQCEEWALLRGVCPEGGLKITGYATDAEVYCAITGGTYNVPNEKAEKEQGTCEFKSGKKCDVWEYFNGKCTNN